MSSLPGLSQCQLLEVPDYQGFTAFICLEGGYNLRGSPLTSQSWLQLSLPSAYVKIGPHGGYESSAAFRDGQGPSRLPQARNSQTPICLSISQGLTSVVWPPQLQLHFQTPFFWPYPQFPALVMARISWM